MNEERMTLEFAATTDWAKGREKDIVKWLENFRPDHRELALQLLRGVRFFNVSDIKHWCQTLHGYLPAEVRKPGDHTRYLGLGLPAESGSLVSYYYRSANGIPVSQFLEPSEAIDGGYLLGQRVDALVFLDDFIGSGHQAIQFWRDLTASLGATTDSLRFFYCAFIGYSEGKRLIEEKTKFSVHLVRELDERDKAFGVGSSLVVEYAREAAKDIFRQYGQRLFPKHPLGYGDGQGLIVFDHNTPNNSLPVLWSEADGWIPLFKRYSKIRIPTGKDTLRQQSTVRAAAKEMAVLFADLVGTSAHTAEEMREMKELVAELLRSARGRLFVFVGDSQVITFSSCTDSLRYAFTLQQRLKARNDAQTSEAKKFEVRIGIDYGPVTDESNELYGATVNRAARVCMICPPREVYFTDSVLAKLHKSEFAVEELEMKFQLKGFKDEMTLYRLVTSEADQFVPNPFVFGQPIGRPQDFIGRARESRLMRSLLHGRQNCQVVGPRRIGKTSFLMQIKRRVMEWEENALTAFIDLQDPSCFTLVGLLNKIGREFGFDGSLSTLQDFGDFVDDNASNGRQLILCLDEFERLAVQPEEFTHEFFTSLRSFGHRGMSIVTASVKMLHELIAAEEPSSPFFNTFAVLRLGSLTEDEALQFVDLHRVGIPPFTLEEKQAILRFATGHPMLLQIACFYVIEAKKDGHTLRDAMDEASDVVASFRLDQNPTIWD